MYIQIYFIYLYIWWPVSVKCIYIYISADISIYIYIYIYIYMCVCVCAVMDAKHLRSGHDEGAARVDVLVDRADVSYLMARVAYDKIGGEHRRSLVHIAGADTCRAEVGGQLGHGDTPIQGGSAAGHADYRRR